MKFILGKMPQNPEFKPEDQGWIPLDEPGSIKIQLFAIPVTVLVALTIQLGFWLVGVDVSPLSKLKNIPIALVIVLGIIPMHELLHFFCLPNFGLNRKSIIGFWPSRLVPYVYYNGALPRNRYILILVCPFVVISVIPLLSSVFKPDLPILIVAVSYLNSLFCGGDLMGLLLLVRQVPSNTLVRNNGYHTFWQRRNEVGST